MAQVMLTLIVWVVIVSVVQYLIARYRGFEAISQPAARTFEDQLWEYLSGEKGRGEERHV